MADPTGVTRRTVTWGKGSGLVLGDDWSISVTVTSSTPELVWSSTGDPVFTAGTATSQTSDPITGLVSMQLIPTDLTGWIDPTTGNPIDPTQGPTHTYTYTVIGTDAEGVQQITRKSNPFTIPSGTTPLDADLFMTYTGPTGITIALPDQWSADVTAAQQSAQAAQTAAQQAVATTGITVSDGTHSAAVTNLTVTPSVFTPPSGTPGQGSLAITLPVVSTATPAMDGTAAVGSSGKWADGAHVHPTDSTRAPAASPTFTGTMTNQGATVLTLGSVSVTTTLAGANTNYVFTGSTASQTLTLPVPAAGKVLNFMNMASVSVTVAAAASTTMTINGVGSIASVVLAPGEGISLYGASTTVWYGMWEGGSQPSQIAPAKVLSKGGTGTYNGDVTLSDDLGKIDTAITAVQAGKLSASFFTAGGVSAGATANVTMPAAQCVFLIREESSTWHTGIFAMGGAGVIAIAAGDGTFSPNTTGAAGKVDLRCSGTTLTLQNNLGGLDGFHVTMLGVL